LEGFAGLENLTTTDSTIQVNANPALLNFNGLEGLTSINGNLIIQNNQNLTSLTGLNNLITLGFSTPGVLAIHDNASLTSLTGLNNINPESINTMSIVNNSVLSTCEVESICGYLANDEGSFQAYDNATGCNSREEVITACTVSADPIQQNSDYSIFPNPASRMITIKSPCEPTDKCYATLCNINGDELLRQPVSQQETTISIKHLSKGIYILTLTKDNAIHQEKIVKL
jgi:hypothetical protein